MGRLLTALIADCEAAPAANPAKVANIAPAPSERFADSQDSQGVEVATPDTVAMRLHLLAVADALAIDAALVRGLPESELAATAEQVAACDPADHQNILRAYLHAVQETAERMAGRVPHGETARALCRGCGPVLVHPAVADAAPVIDGWPRLLGCPWCTVRHAGKYVPRPSVQCGDCQHFERDAINPAAGVGRCRLGRGLQHGEPMHYPNATRQCPRFTP